MDKSKITLSHRRPLGPKVEVSVTAEMINTGVIANSGHCMISDAIRAVMPEARHIASDIATIRFTDPERGFRYVYLTPRIAQEALVDFDEGLKPKPFRFRLSGAHVSKAGHKHRKPEARAKDAASAKARRARKAVLPTRATLHATHGTKERNQVPQRLGGKRPPQLHLRREFGLRAFRAASIRRLQAEQAPSDLVEDDSE